jgi:hypothetical protein
MRCRSSREAHRQAAPLLDGLKIFVPQRAFAQWAREPIGGGDRVLHREIDSHAADRRHRMCRIADADQSRPPPASQSIDRDAEEADVVPAFQFADAIGQKGRHSDDALAEGFEALRLHALDPALRNDIGALPVVARSTMTMSLPLSIWPKVSVLSLPLGDMRNQSTSIGAP